VNREIENALSGADRAKIQRLVDYMDMNTADPKIPLEQLSYIATQQQIFAQLKEKGIKNLADERKRQQDELDAEEEEWIRRHGPQPDPAAVNHMFFGPGGSAWG
jgi:hypothetical protein